MPPICAGCRRTFGDRAYLALTLRHRPNDAVPAARLADMAPRGAGADGRDRRRALSRARPAHAAGRGDLHPRSCTIDEAGFRRERLADRHLQAARGNGAPLRAITRTPSRARSEIAERCRFSLERACAINIRRDRGPGPDAAADPGAADLGGRRAPLSRRACPSDVAAQLRHELNADRANWSYAPYFLTVDSIVRFARSQGHPLPGPRLGRQLRGLLRARHHLHRSGPPRAAVRALRLRTSATSRRTSMSISSTSGARK